MQFLLDWGIGLVVFVADCQKNNFCTFLLCSVGRNSVTKCSADIYLHSETDTVIVIFFNIFQLLREFQRYKELIKRQNINKDMVSERYDYNCTPAPRRGRRVYCFTSFRPSVRPRYFSSHFSQ